MPLVEDNFDPYEGPAWDEIVGLNYDASYFDKLYQNGELYVNQEFGKIEIKPWQLFTDKQHLRDVIRDYAIQCGFSIIVDKANNSRYTIQCSADNCAWRLHASRLPDGQTWAIKSIKPTEHTCAGLETKNSMVSSKWVARVLLEDIRANNDIPAKALNELLWQRYGVQMCKTTLYRMRSEALVEIHGGHDTSYSYLPRYCEMIKMTNPQSTEYCAWTSADHAQRPLTFTSIFICFKATLDGLFAGCRSSVGVDGCHLKGNYGGILLSAVALDGNNELFPFAWAIVGGRC
ncbi:Ribosome maturation factor RimP [Bienertia sinuspersici]